MTQPRWAARDEVEEKREDKPSREIQQFHEQAFGRPRRDRRRVLDRLRRLADELLELSPDVPAADNAVFGRCAGANTREPRWFCTCGTTYRTG